MVMVRWCTAARRRSGLRSFPGNLLQRGLLQLRVGQQPLQCEVLPLEVLQPLRVVRLQPAELVAPPVVRRLGHPQLPAHRRYILALGQKPVRGRQLPHHLLRAVPLPRRHDPQAFLPLTGQSDSHSMRTDQRGSGQYLKSLTIKEELADRPGMANTYHQLGILEQRRGNLDTAGQWYLKSLRGREELSPSSMGVSCSGAGCSSSRRGSRGVPGSGRRLRLRCS